MSTDRYSAALKQSAERAEKEIAARATAYRLLTTEELQAQVERRGNSPWERAALRRVLRERGAA